MLTVESRTAAQHRRYPSISLLLPVAGATPWQQRLDGLRRTAEQRLVAEFGAAVDRDLLDAITETVAGVDVPVDARSIAVYVNALVSRVEGLGVEVRERVVIDDTFATRDLVAAELRQPRYWVLALNLDQPRLLRGQGSRLQTCALELTDAAPHPSSGRGDRRRDRDQVSDAIRVRRLRAVDMALTEALAADRDPLLVVAAEPTLGRFLDRTRHVARIEGVVRRAPDSDNRVLAEAIAPTVAELLAERRLHALQMLDRAVSRGDASSGVEPVWRAVRRGAGLLLVEATYEQAATIDIGGYLRTAEDPAAPGVVDDVVDEIIEAVLGRGGRVELVPDGVLGRHQRIAYVPWQQRRKR